MKNQSLDEELEQNGRRLRHRAGLLAVPAHVPPERLPHLEDEPADMALVRCTAAGF
jgi:hypothetical protein